MTGMLRLVLVPLTTGPLVSLPSGKRHRVAPISRLGSRLLPGWRMTATLGTLGDNAKTFMLDPPCLLDLLLKVL